VRASFSLNQPPLRVAFGVGAVTRVPEEVDVLGRQRIMVISSASAHDAAAGLRDRLEQRCVDLIRGVRQHVPAADADAASEKARRTKADCIVAIGGGSAIGLAKAVALETGASIIAVPTTYSGSEMTSIFGITGESGKSTGRDERVRPRAVVYDPELTTSLPPHASAATGMNALAHCAESLYAPDRSPVTTLLASKGACSLVQALPAVITSPEDIERRSDALLGAFYAGWCLALTTMGLHHRICHVLGGSYGISHGYANAVMLPYVVAFNAETARNELAPVAQLFDGTLAPAVRTFVSALGLPTTLAETGWPRAEAAAAARLVLSSPVPNPRAIDVSAVQRLLLAACDGRLPG
jgi:maleylacetate reductase